MNDIRQRIQAAFPHADLTTNPTAWDATNDLDACSVVRQARVWRELAEPPVDAASWWGSASTCRRG